MFEIKLKCEVTKANYHQCIFFLDLLPINPEKWVELNFIQFVKETSGYAMSLKYVYAYMHMYESTLPKVSNKVMHIRGDYIAS